MKAIIRIAENPGLVNLARHKIYPKKIMDTRIKKNYILPT